MSRAEDPRLGNIKDLEIAYSCAKGCCWSSVVIFARSRDNHIVSLFSLGTWWENCRELVSATIILNRQEMTWTLLFFLWSKGLPEHLRHCVWNAYILLSSEIQPNSWNGLSIYFLRCWQLTAAFVSRKQASSDTYVRLGNSGVIRT
jgi:hypothetical protein